MNSQTLKQRIFKDKYLDNAYNRYLSFKESPEYDEQYKFEVLEELNGYFREHSITEGTVIDLAKKIQSSNPSSGSFAHWNNTDTLVKFAEGNPTEAARVWNNLYDENYTIRERIAVFRKSVNDLNASMAIGAPLFGYLLAAYDYTIYPLYKGPIYQEVNATYELKQKMGSVEDNYAAYYAICQTIIGYLENENADLTMLDIQDFLYCSNRYSKPRVEAAADYLSGLSKELYEYQQNPSKLLETIISMSQETLQELHGIYSNGEKIRKIRFLVLDKILQDGSMTISDLERFKTDVSQEYDTNILQSYNNFTILFHLFYHDKKEKVKLELGKIHQAIRQFEELKELEFVENKVLNGFNWNQSFGGSECWLAVYETKYKTHRSAPQFFLRVRKEGVRFGLVYGDYHADNGMEDVEVITDTNDFTYESLEEKMNQVALEFKKMEEPAQKDQPYDHFSEDAFTKNEWLEHLNNPALFQEDDVTMFKEMYDMGGEATASQLGESLGKHHSFFNSLVGRLAKRIYETTMIQPLIGDDEKISYWRLFFNGNNESNNHFKWIMKDNLREAMADYMETMDVPRVPVYTKEDFLYEVFIDEETYDTMTDLLRYKMNIILQGPPGVGKTFVAKRLAYSLIGKKDSERVEIIQFHQNYAYEDFVMGFRPREEEAGFGLEFGVFYEFCLKAMKNPEKDYYFVIDEINRGNLSKIFGELFMLIEGDKRDEYVTMGYSKQKFTVPSNVYLIGTMNTADRSLAQLEIALRRRFAFITLTASYNDKWQNHVESKGVSKALIERISLAMERINLEIHQDFQLGPGYEIGHSFFTNIPEGMDEERWFEQVINYEIKPLLEEYYFDRPEVVRSLLEGM